MSVYSFQEAKLCYWCDISLFFVRNHALHISVLSAVQLKHSTHHPLIPRHLLVDHQHDVTRSQVSPLCMPLGAVSAAAGTLPSISFRTSPLCIELVSAFLEQKSVFVKRQREAADGRRRRRWVGVSCSNNLGSSETAVIERSMTIPSTITIRVYREVGRNL